MELSNLTEIDSSIILGIAVSIIVMSLAVLYDKYRGKKSTDPNISISSIFEMLGQPIDLSSLKVSNPFAGSGQKIRNLIASNPSSKENKASELAADTEPNNAGIKAVFGNLKSKILSIKLSLPGKGDRENETMFEDMHSSKNAASTEEESNINFDVDEIIENKKSELDFDDDLIDQMATAGSLASETEVEEPDSNLSLNGDLSIDMDEFDFGFGGDGNEQDDSLDNEFAFDVSGDDSYDNDFTQVVAVDDISFDDNDDFIESLKKDIVIDDKDKIDFMSKIEGESLDIEEIKTELEWVLATLKKYNHS